MGPGLESHGTSVSFLFSLVEKFFKSTCSVLDYLLQFVVIISGMAVLAIIDDKTTDLLGLNTESSVFGGYMNFECLNTNFNAEEEFKKKRKKKKFVFDQVYLVPKYIAGIMECIKEKAAIRSGRNYGYIRTIAENWSF